MGRKRVGPRREQRGGNFYAILKTPDGRFFKESLRTKDHALAMRRYGPAMDRLHDRANGVVVAEIIKPSDPATVFDWKEGQGWVERETTCREIYEPEDFTITWQQALALHLRRRQERTGKPAAASTVKCIQNAIKYTTVGPTEMNPAEVRAYIERLRAAGQSPTSINQKASLLQAVTETLVKQDHLQSNPWKRVDFSAKSTAHITEATPEHLKLVAQAGDPALLTLLYTGIRIGELCSRDASHLTDAWLDICPTPTWQPKTESSIRRVLLPEWVASHLKLPTVGRTRLSSRLKEACPGISPHSLRHSFRSACREALLPTELAEHLLGHAHKGLVGTYGSWPDAAVREAAEKVWAVLDRWVQASSPEGRSLEPARNTRRSTGGASSRQSRQSRIRSVSAADRLPSLRP
jgi:integrase